MINYRHVPVLLLGASCQILLGCASGVSVQKVDNTERTFIRWQGVEPEKANKDRSGSCLEFSTAAATLKDAKVEAKGGYVGIQAGLEVNTAQRLGRIYEVQSIMQFAHAALFRLCEAQRNGDLPDGEFSVLFRQSLFNVQGLLVAADLSSAVRQMSELIVRLNVERGKLARKAEDAEKSIRAIKAGICGQLAKDSDRARCQVKLSDWARGVLEMDIDVLEEMPPYDEQVRDSFVASGLEKPGKLDFIELMTLVKAYSARTEAKRMIQQNVVMVEAARLGLEAVASLVPALSRPHSVASIKAPPGGKLNESAGEAAPGDPPAEQGKDAPRGEGNRADVND